jgi:hypothetical protein
MEYNTERLRFAARNYGRLQNLEWAIIGLIFLLLGCVNWFGGPAVRGREGLHSPIKWAFLVVILALSYISSKIPKFYREKYGTVSTKAAETIEFADTVRRIGILALGVLCIFIIPAYFPSLVNRFWLVVGACLIGAEFQRDFMVHRIVAGLIFLGLSAAPLLHWATNEQLAQGMKDIVSGLALIVIGLGDHWVLVRSLPPVKAQESHG